MKCDCGYISSGDVCGLCGHVFKAKKEPIKEIRKVGKKRSKELAEYSNKKRKFLELNPMCAVFPSKRAEDIHHIRGKVGSRFLDERYWLAVSRSGHIWIHANEVEASKKGWVLSRLEKIEDTI